MFDAIIFDFDGTILDTETAGYRAWVAVYDHYGLEFPFELWKQNIGQVDVFLPADYLVEKLGLDTAPVKLKEMRRSIRMEILSETDTLPGVREMIAEAKAAGLKLGVASSSTTNWLNYHLPRLGLLFEFEAVRGRNDVGDRAKPDPAVYLSACEGLKIDPTRALAFEDSEHGVTAAKAAGLTVVAIPNPVTRTLNFEHADLVLNSMADLTLNTLFEHFAA